MSFRPYPEYRNSDDAWVGAIPSAWKVVPLKAVTTCNDETLGEDADPSLEIDYVEISDVDPVFGVKGTTKMSLAAAPSRARRLVQEGDVIVSTVRTYLRAIASIRLPSPDLVVSTGFAVIRPRRVDAKFLAYTLKADFFIENVISRSVGVSYPAINAKDLHALTIPLPPEDEQQAIGAFLDRETAKIQDLIAEQERLIELLGEKRQATISHAVTKGRDPSVPMKASNLQWSEQVPEHWDILPLRALFRFVRRQNGEVAEVLSVYRDYGVIPKESRDDNNNKTPEDLSAYQTVRPGDLVINKMKSWQGSLGISNQHGITSPDYAVFEPIRVMNFSFINFLLRCNLLPGIYRSISNGIRPDQWRLEPDKFKTLHIPFPPETEQAQIAERLTSTISEYERLAAEAGRAMSLLTERRAALISAAVTGKIDVRNYVADDLPLQEAAE